MIKYLIQFDSGEYVAPACKRTKDDEIALKFSSLNEAVRFAKMFVAPLCKVTFVVKNKTCIPASQKIESRHD